MPHYNPGIVKQCIGCVKITRGKCAALIEPGYFWDEYGECFARSEDADWWKKHKKAVEEYKKYWEGSV